MPDDLRPFCVGLCFGLFYNWLDAGFMFSGMAALATYAVSGKEKGACLNSLYAWLAMGVVLGPFIAAYGKFLIYGGLCLPATELSF